MMGTRPRYCFAMLACQITLQSSHKVCQFAGRNSLPVLLKECSAPAPLLPRHANKCLTFLKKSKEICPLKKLPSSPPFMSSIF